MPIPDFQSLMLPLLELVRDGKEYALRDLSQTVADRLSLTPTQLAEVLPSGKQHRFRNRLNWARAHLKAAGLVEITRRGYFKITPRGLEVLQSPPTKISLSYLDQFPGHEVFRKGANPQTNGIPVPAADDRPPEEAMDDLFKSTNQKLASEILDQIKKCSPSFFERLVVDLLVKMGYGGTLADAGEAIGRSGDGGIDGTIKEDKLGLDVIYLQAKRWENVVGRPQIQNFVGALHGKGSKGVFITTSAFSKEALDYARSLGNLKLILIDGEKLAELMIDHNAGVATKQVYEIKKIDYDYFSEEE